MKVIGSVAMVTLMAKLLGFVREALQARTFGTEQIVDVYTAAYNSTDYLFTTIGYALCIAAIPIITQKLRVNRAEGFAAANNIICVTVGFSLLVMVAGLIFPYSTLIYGQVDAVSLAWFSRVLMLTLPVVVATYLFLALLQSLEHYMLQGSLSLPYNIFLIGFLALAAGRTGMEGYVVAVAAAWLLQFAMVVPQLYREQYRFRPSFDLRAPYMGKYIKTAAVTVFTTTTYLFCYLMDTSAGAAAGEGVVSAFYYADKFFTPIVTTLVYSISIVMFPKFNFRYVDSSESEYKSYVWNVAEKTVMLLLPLSAIFAVFAVPVVKVMFEGGSFDAESTVTTGRILYFYLAGMTGFALLDILAKAFYTMGKVLIPLVVNLAVLALNLVLNYFCFYYPQGSGLAFATSLSLTLGAVVLACLFFRGMPGKMRGLLRIGKSLLATVIIAVPLLFFYSNFVNIGDRKLFLVGECLLAGAVAFILYLLICSWMGEKEMLQTITRKLRRKKNAA